MVDGDYCVCTDAIFCLYFDFSIKSECFGQELDYIKVMPTSTPLKCLFVLASVGYKLLGGDARLLVRVSSQMKHLCSLIMLHHMSVHFNNWGRCWEFVGHNQMV